MKLSIIIVNYNVKHFLEQCLHSVNDALTEIDAEIFVVDNNSVDGSVEMVADKFPEVKLIANTENVGFAKANNQALHLAKGEYVLLLNPDTLVEEDTFTKCIAFLDETPDAGALGVKMVNGKGEFLPESKRGLPVPHVAFYKIFGLSKIFPKSKRFGYYHLTYLDKDEINPVDVLSGAFMMMRKSVLDQVGFLDEDYFMYGEDIDLSYRITQSGYKNYYFPDTRIIHYKGESTKKGSLNYVYVFYKAMQIFAQKHFSKKNAGLFNWMINLAIWLRATLSMIKRVLVAIFPAVIDFILIYAGMIVLSFYWEHAVLMPRESHFPDEYRLIFIPIYVLVWILSIALCAGYKKPIRLSNTNKGIFLGTVLILLAYALLPEDFRFSRAVILFGAMWTLIALNAIRYILYKLHVKNYVIGSKPNRRIAVVGNCRNAERVRDLACLLNDDKVEFTGLIAVNESEYEENRESMLGTLRQIKDIITIFHIEELIFCSGDLPANKIIDLMSEMQDNQIDFKIAPQESAIIIGSNSVYAPTDFYTYNLHSVNKKENRRKKRFFDIITSLFLILFLPIDIWFVKKKGHFIVNIFLVLAGKNTWVGYDSKLLQKKGILYPVDAYQQDYYEKDLVEKINHNYVHNYHFANDLRIVMRGFKNLGR